VPLKSEPRDIIDGIAESADGPARSQCQGCRSAVYANHSACFSGKLLEIATVDQMHPIANPELPRSPVDEAAPIEYCRIEGMLFDYQMSFFGCVPGEAFHDVSSR
jgi:hypothetical protein